MKVYFFKILIVLYFIFNFNAQANVESVYIKNFRELAVSYEMVTGVSRLHSEILNYYNRSSKSFPQEGIFEELSSDFLFVNTSYASLFCNRMIQSDKNKESSKRWTHTLLDFNQPLPEVTEEILKFTLNEYAQLFYQRDLEEVEQSYFLTLYKDLTKENKNTTQSSVQVWTGVCAAFGSSFDFLRKM